MCGILCCVAEDGGSLGGAWLGPLSRRGPDGIGVARRALGGARGGARGGTLELWASVLQMRGVEPCMQPLERVDVAGGCGERAGDAFAWNGEVYGGGVAVGEGESDTARVWEALSKSIAEAEERWAAENVPERAALSGEADGGDGAGAASPPSSSLGPARAGLLASAAFCPASADPSATSAPLPPPSVALAAVARTLETVDGPWAFVFWRESSRTLLFGRDELGRKSLLVAGGGERGWDGERGGEGKGGSGASPPLVIASVWADESAQCGQQVEGTRRELAAAEGRRDAAAVVPTEAGAEGRRDAAAVAPTEAGAEGRRDAAAVAPTEAAAEPAAPSSGIASEGDRESMHSGSGGGPRTPSPRPASVPASSRGPSSAVSWPSLPAPTEVAPGVHAARLSLSGRVVRLSFLPIRGPIVRAYEAARELRREKEAGIERGADPEAERTKVPERGEGPGLVSSGLPLPIGRPSLAPRALHPPLPSVLPSPLDLETLAAARAILRALRLSVRRLCRLPERRGGEGAGAGAGAGAAVPPLRSVAVLFSGGVDSTLVASLAASEAPPGTTVDLLASCFAGGRSPDRLAALDAVTELRARHPSTRFRLIATDPPPGAWTPASARWKRLERLVWPKETAMDVNIAAPLWLAAGGGEAVEGGERRGGAPGGEGDKEGERRGDAWGQGSGGPGGGRGGAPKSAGGSSGTAAALPGRGGEAPLLPVLLRDTSRGDARGEARGEGAGEPGQSGAAEDAAFSSARVLLIGSGADELFGGYGRHASALASGGGYAALEEALDREFENLPSRNLGRDDRVLSDCGRETRHPFLDPRVVLAARATRIQALSWPGRERERQAERERGGDAQGRGTERGGDAQGRGARGGGAQGGGEAQGRGAEGGRDLQGGGAEGGKKAEESGEAPTALDAPPFPLLFVLPGAKGALRWAAALEGLPRAAARTKRAAQFGSGSAKACSVALYGSARKGNKRGGGKAVVARGAEEERT